MNSSDKSELPDPRFRQMEVPIPEELTEKGRRIGSLERQNGIRRWIGLKAGENTDLSH